MGGVLLLGACDREVVWTVDVTLAPGALERVADEDFPLALTTHTEAGPISALICERPEGPEQIRLQDGFLGACPQAEPAEVRLQRASSPTDPCVEGGPADQLTDLDPPVVATDAEPEVDCGRFTFKASVAFE